MECLSVEMLVSQACCGADVITIVVNAQLDSFVDGVPVQDSFDGFTRTQVVPWVLTCRLGWRDDCQDSGLCCHGTVECCLALCLCLLFD